MIHPQAHQIFAPLAYQGWSVAGQVLHRRELAPVRSGVDHREQLLAHALEDGLGTVEQFGLVRWGQRGGQQQPAEVQRGLLLLPGQLPAQTTTDEAMLAVLVRAPGWRAEWSGPGGSGITDVVFERTAAGITARIHLITPFDMTCENPVTVSPGRVTFDGCRDPAVSLTYDPSNPDMPFQGGSPRGYAWKVRPK